MALAGQLIREARRRAGLTQAELARRARTTQSVIARLERGVTSPSLERVRQLVDAAGLELRVGISSAEAQDWTAVARNLTLTAEQRWDKAVASAQFVEAGRAAMARRRR
jgi:transcriptional regulator with XRE-family HTH domain